MFREKRGERTARRVLVRQLMDQSLSERLSLGVVRMSASTLRYELRPDRNVDLRERIMALAQRHRRYGVGMIHLKLQLAGLPVNYKGVERLYPGGAAAGAATQAQEGAGQRAGPLLRPDHANAVSSMDFVFDRTAEGLVLKCLTIADDATHETVSIAVERAISGHGVVCVMERLALSRSLHHVIRTENGKEFCGKAMVTWAYQRGVHLRLIDPGKP